MRAAAVEAGAFAAVTTNHHALGGAGAVDLGEAVVQACNQESKFSFLYDVDLSIKVGYLLLDGCDTIIIVKNALCDMLATHQRRARSGSAAKWLHHCSWAPGCHGQQLHEGPKTGNNVCSDRYWQTALHNVIPVSRWCDAMHCALIAGQDRGHCLRDIWSSCCELQPRSGGSNPGGLSSMTAQRIAVSAVCAVSCSLLLCP